jgi:hypothetical protein
MISVIQKEGMVALKIAQYMQEVRSMQDELSGGGGEDPLIALKQQELQQRAQNDQADNQIDQQRLALDQQRLQQKTALDQQRLALQMGKAQQAPQGVRNAA